jgi:putative flippase GtrA
MKNAFSRLSPHTRRYLITGVSVYLFELVIIVIVRQLGGSAVLATGLSFWLGLITSFVIQKLFTFGDKRTSAGILGPQLIAFSVLVLFNFAFTLFVTHLLEKSLPATVIRTIALIITTFWNFYLYKTRIFKVDDGVIY